MKKYLELKKDNYLAVIPFTEDKKMVEVEAKNEEEAHIAACKYVTKICARLGYMYVDPLVIRIPDCITVID